jgi:holo-[acyl-carrier protein] synthase
LPRSLSSLHPAPKIGVEMLEIERVRRMLDRTPSTERLLFTERERLGAHRAVDPAPRFARLLAAKETVLKALGLGPLNAWAARVEIVGDSSQEPKAFVDGWPEATEIHLSISTAGPVTIAVAVLPD